MYRLSYERKKWYLNHSGAEYTILINGNLEADNGGLADG